MSNQEPKPKRSQNRPTDSFGGPPKGSNSATFSVVAIAFVFFLITQWTNGNLGAWLSGSATQPTVVAQSENSQPIPTVQETVENEAAAAQTTEVPQQAPTAANSGQARGVQTPRATTQPSPTANAPPVERASDLPTIAYNELPREAHDTIALIKQDGPFPYSRDGVTFQNRERILPRTPEGYYREYTVITPGENDRGARRIVTGEEGEMYYTDDHYESFSEIIR